MSWPKKIRDAVAARSGGVCESCGVARATDIHHRKYKSRGGADVVHNALALCGGPGGLSGGNHSGCHGRAHAGGEELGLSVWSWGRPEWWPVMYRGRWVLLLDEADQSGSWVTEISESVADMLKRGLEAPENKNGEVA